MTQKLDYDDVVRHLPEAMIFADKEGTIQAWNPAAESVFGFSAEEVLGKTMDIIIPESLRAAHWKGYEMAMQKGEVLSSSPAHPSRMTKALHKSGQPLYVDMSFAIVKDSAGNTIGSFAVARQATERFQQERAARRELAELKAKVEKPAQ